MPAQASFLEPCNVGASILSERSESKYDLIIVISLLHNSISKSDNSSVSSHEWKKINFSRDCSFHIDAFSLGERKYRKEGVRVGSDRRGRAAGVVVEVGSCIRSQSPQGCAPR